jgi:hypothetical protein
LSAICGVISDLVEVLSDGVEIAQLDARKLQIGARVEVSETLEAEPPDLLGGHRATRALDLVVDLLHQFVDLRSTDRALVCGPPQTAAQLLGIEALARPVALDHVGGLGVAALVGGEALAAIGAAAAPAHGAARTLASLEDVGLGSARRTIHAGNDSGASVRG